MGRTGLIGISLFTLLVVIGTAGADDISITVYNSNLGVVHETRALEFEKGDGNVSFTDVPSQIDPTSVGFELVDPGKSVAILEQNYAYDLVSPEKIYSKYVDRKIDLFDETGNMFSGTLLSFSGGAFVLQGDNGRVQTIRTEQVVNANFPDLPEGLITRPTLFWLYSSDFSGQADCKVGDVDHLLDFAHAFGHDLAHFVGNELAQGLFVLTESLGHLADDLATLRSRHHAPLFERFLGRGHDLLVVLRAGHLHLGNDLAVHR